MDFVSFVQEKFGKVGAILPCDSRNQRFLS